MAEYSVYDSATCKECGVRVSVTVKAPKQLPRNLYNAVTIYCPFCRKVLMMFTPEVEEEK